MIRRLVPVYAAPALPWLARLEWKPAGGRPGCWAMLDVWPAGMPLAPIFDAVAPMFPARRRSKTMLSRLVPGQVIEPHRDYHEGRNRVRIHVPLLTNPAALFTCGGETVHMAAGWAWEIDPTEEHGVVNGGATDRVHLFWNQVPL